MSFAEQERALFDLLFDNSLRDHFFHESVAALGAYELNDEELADFAEIRPDALVLDAKMRRNILLTHICRSFPVSFAIVCSLEHGRQLLKGLVDTHTMRANSIDRAQVFGSRLRESLSTFAFDTDSEQPLVIAILEAELAMAITAAALKKEVLKTGKQPEEPLAIPDNWPERSISLAAHVAATMIPSSYTELKRSFCPVPDTELWNHLVHSPASRSLRNSVLKKEVPRLLVIRAHLNHMSSCEPGVDHRTAELSDGFAPLFGHINGSMSAGQILEQLGKAGAPEQILQSVRAGFLQLLEYGMLELAR